MFLISLLTVAVPLALTGIRVTQQVIYQSTSRQLTEAWLAGTEFEVRSVQVVDNAITILVTSPGETPPFTELVESLKTAMGTDVSVELETVQSQKDAAPAQTASAS